MTNSSSRSAHCIALAMFYNIGKRVRAKTYTAEKNRVRARGEAAPLALAYVHVSINQRISTEKKTSNGFRHLSNLCTILFLIIIPAFLAYI